MQWSPCRFFFFVSGCSGGPARRAACCMVLVTARPSCWHEHIDADDRSTTAPARRRRPQEFGERERERTRSGLVLSNLVHVLSQGHSNLLFPVDGRRMLPLAARPGCIAADDRKTACAAAHHGPPRAGLAAGLGRRCQKESSIAGRAPRQTPAALRLAPAQPGRPCDVQRESSSSYPAAFRRLLG